MGFSLPFELEELNPLKQWVGYRLSWDDKRGKSRKIPVNPHTGENAKANDAATWGTFDEAMSWALQDAQSKGVQIGQAGGVGFEFGEPAGIMGIDLDAVILEDGTLKPFADEIVRMLDSYTEYSPSGRGLHIFCKIDKPLSSIGNNRRNDGIGLEMYDTSRFFTVTGQIYGEAKTIKNRSEEIKKIYDKYLLKDNNKNSITTPSHSLVDNFYSRNDTDFEILEKMFNSRHGREVRALYDGDISAYGDDWSRADLALCSHLAYWTGGDARRIDDIFRQSRLMRPKWDERHGAQTYGAMTIDKALQNTKVYIPRQSGIYSQPYFIPEFDDYEPYLPPDFIPDDATPEKTALKVRPIAQYLDGVLEDDLKRFQKYSGRKTGFANIDAQMSLFPGLYIIGGLSSLGKTTFAHQMADQLAKAGDHVLYFSVEQSELELVSKGLARLTAQENSATALSSVEIRSGRITDALRRAIAEYKGFSEYEAIIELGFDAKFDDVANTVREYIATTGERPVVFLDYIQLLRPLNSKLTAKDATDYAVRAFKQLQLEFDLVIVLLSSLNRTNYLTPIDFEAFKESGSLEFTADVLLGLQLQVMNDEIFNAEKKTAEKRAIIKNAKKANPRQIELVVLKNRFGVSNASYYFNYYPKYDIFTPTVDADEEAEDYPVKYGKAAKIV